MAYTQDQAAKQISDYTSQKYGMTPSAEQLSLLGGSIGYTGGDVDEALLQKALGGVDNYFATAGGSTGGAPAGSQPPQQSPQPQQPEKAPGAANSPVTPTGQISPAYAGSTIPSAQTYDPNQAASMVQGTFQMKHGRGMTPEEFQALQSAVGYQPGGPVTQAMIDQANQLIASYGGGGGGGGTPAQAPVINNPNWTPGTFTAVPTNRKDFGSALNAYMDKFRGQAGDPYQFGMYAGVNRGGEEDAQIGALIHALQNSEWSPGRVAAQKEVQKEQILQMEKDLAEQMGDRYAGMGRGESSALDAGTRRLGQDARSQILASYRDIDENAAQNRRMELLSTSGALDQALGGEASRAMGQYQTGLEGQTRQADENYRNLLQPTDLALRATLGEIASDMDYNNLDWSKEQFAQLFPEDQRQANIGSILQFLQLMENQRQYNEGLGLDWTKFNFNSIFPQG